LIKTALAVILACFVYFKVQLFSEDHKNLELSSTCFDIYIVNQPIYENDWKITAKFCGLLRKAELYTEIIGFLVVLQVCSYLKPTETIEHTDFLCYSFHFSFRMKKI
jgi:hypothetical protein